MAQTHPDLPYPQDERMHTLMDIPYLNFYKLSRICVTRSLGGTYMTGFGKSGEP